MRPDQAFFVPEHSRSRTPIQLTSRDHSRGVGSSSHPPILVAVADLVIRSRVACPRATCRGSRRRAVSAFETLRGPQQPPLPGAPCEAAPASNEQAVQQITVGATHRRCAPSAVLFRNATPSVLNQCHFGRVLRSSCNSRGRRLASSRGREPQPGRCPSLWPGDLRNDGISVAAADADGSET